MELMPAPPPPPTMEKMGLDFPSVLDENDEDDYNPDATVIAQVPDNLLKVSANDSAEPPAQATSLVPPPPTVLPKPPVVASVAPTSPPASTEDAHFNEVFEKFIETKKQNGEPVAGLTVEKFVEKLRKNSSDLKSRYHCNSAKFQVYVKNGKAALKATPIK